MVNLAFLIPKLLRFLERPIEHYTLMFQILTKDSVTIAVDAVVYFRVVNSMWEVTQIDNFAYSTRLLAQTTLRNILGTKTLAEILGEREAVSHLMQVRYYTLAPLD